MDDNKREAGARFLNHLIDLGAVIMDGPIITAGPNFQRYVAYLNLGRYGHYNVHNARCGVEQHLGTERFRKQEYHPPVTPAKSYAESIKKGLLAAFARLETKLKKKKEKEDEEALLVEDTL